MSRGELLNELAADFETTILADGGAWVEIEYWPSAEPPGRKLRAIVIDRHLEGTREADGDGVANFNQIDGRKRRETITVYTTGKYTDENGVEKQIPVNQNPTTEVFDRVKLIDTDETFNTKRVTGEYNGSLYKILCAKVTTEQARRVRRTG